MNAPYYDQSDSLDELRCRDDILQVMYWMRGEGFGEHHTTASLAGFLIVEDLFLKRQLAVLVEDGLLILGDGVYSLSDDGVREGGRRFHDEFADLQKSAHGECGPDCPYCKGIRGEDCPHCQIAAD